MRVKAFLAEFLGTGTLVAVVVGSGTMATQMSADPGVQLLINTISTVFALGILIFIFGSISGRNLWLGEILATAGLLFLIQILRAQKKDSLAPVVIASWIGSAYFFTSSTSFANPAVTLARTFSDTLSGIAMASIGMFVLAQLILALLGSLTENFSAKQRWRI